MLKILNLSSFLTTFCMLVFISSSFAAEPPLSKFAIKRLQTIVNEQGYEVSVNGRLDTKTNGLIREIFKKQFSDKNFSYKKFFSLKKKTKVRDKNFNYEKFLSRKHSKKNAVKQVASEDDLLIKNLFVSYALIAKNNTPPHLASQKLLKLIKTIDYLRPQSIPNSDIQFLTDKYGKKFTDIHISATENNDVNALMILVKIYSIFSNRKNLESDTRLSLIARWTAQAAKAGDLQSIVNLGHMVGYGRGVLKSKFKALRIYQYARDQGFKGDIFQLDEAIAQKKLEQREAIAKKILEQSIRKNRELELKASRDAQPTTKAITKLVPSAVMDIMCSKRNHVLGSAKSGSIWNMVIASSPDTMKRVGNQCILKHLAGNYAISVINVRNINCNKTGVGYDCSFGFSIDIFGPGMELYGALFSISKIVQPATATFSIREGTFYPFWTISNLEMIGSAKEKKRF